MRQSLARLLALPLLAAPALAATPELLQPPSSERGLQLEVSPSRAWLLRSNGQRQRLPLRRGEEIRELVEFENGWAAAGDRAIGARRELAVIVDGAAGVERLPRVPEQTGDLRVRPVPLASPTAFEGLAWLEGDAPSAYEVRVADWTGADWGPPLTVSAARPGGQAGLTGAVLEDGRWLLVWAVAGAQGSEIVWSVRDGSHWTAPRRLAAPDRAPDVTPALLRVPGGALLVWAHRTGGAYGLRTARFGDGWSAPRRLGTAGAWEPRFAELAETGRFLLHRSPGGWAALELDVDGRELRRAEIAGDGRARPVLTAAGGGVALRWERGGEASPLRWKAAR